MLKSPAMTEEQIGALLDPFRSPPPTEQQVIVISMYIDLLTKWNRQLNLTAIRDPGEIVTRHFGESLFAAGQLLPAARGFSEAGSKGVPPVRLADVGSGAGFPGLPIKIFFPEVQVTLIESQHKKATFLREVIRTLKLKGAEVFAGRAEDFPTASSEVVTLRAVERFDEVLIIAARLVSPGGRLALLIGKEQVKRAIVRVPSFNWNEAVPVPLSTSRVLLIGSAPAV